MSIVQISKIQQRSGNLVDLPQLDEAEFGWASDSKRLFIGKTTPNENIEVMTSYSQINFSQINGVVGNLNISNVTVADGQLLVYDGTDWVNRGGTAGGLITLGDVANVSIAGGAIGYVLETDGLGNLSWTPKSSIVTYIENVTQANPAVVTTTEDNFLVDGMEVTITNAAGMSQLNGNTYYANVLTSNTFSLYSDSSLTVTVNSTGYTAYSYTTAASTNESTDRVTVGNSAPFSLNQEVRFTGDLSTSGLELDTSYYVKTKPTGTTVTLSDSIYANGTAGDTFQLVTATLSSSYMYGYGGRAVASVGGTGTSAAAGSNSTVQFNNSNLLDGDADFTWNDSVSPKVLTVTNANVVAGNLNATSTVTAPRLISNVATGTAPLTVTSTTRVSNLNVAYSNVSDFNVVTAQTTGTYYPVFVNGSTTANRALGANANLSFNVATGNLSVTLLNVTANANVGNLGTGGLITATGNITGGNLNTGGVLSVTGNANVGNIGAAAGVFTGTLSVTGNANVGNLGTAGLITATGNITGGNLITAGLLSVTGNANVGNIGATNANITAITASGNANVGNLGTGGLITATGNITGGNLVTGGSLSVTGNANVGNLGTSGLITATGNITGGNLIGTLANGNSNVAITSNANITFYVAGNATARFVATTTGVNVAGTLNATGNANVGNIGATNANLTALTASGNANVGNLGTGGLIVATGNITGGNLVTGGSLSVTGNANVGNIGATNANLTALTASGNANVGNLGTGALVATGNVSFTGSNVALGANGNVRITGGSSGQLLSTDGVGNLSWVSQGSVIGGAAGSNTQIQYNALGLLAASANFTFNYATNVLNVNGNITSNGTIGGVSADLYGSVLTTGNISNAGTITGNWTLSAGSKMEATYADLAEYYEADDVYVWGTVLEFGGDKEVTTATNETTRVAGVVSKNPAYVMNATCPGLLTAVALQGRVPCKVFGNVRKGDIMVSAGDGYAKACSAPILGTVIGKALKDFDGVEGIVEIAVGRL